MAFGVASDYDRFMGRWSRRLAPGFGAFAAVAPGQRVLDVGCGSGVLTRHLVELLGADRVAAIDPAPGFVEAVRAAFPDVDVRQGAAESLPWADATFDGALAQLVIRFTTDPLTAVREMARVTRSGGTVAACSWDETRMEMLALFWAAVADADALPDGSGGDPAAGRFPDTQALEDLWREAGLREVRTAVLEVSEEYGDAEDCWAPLTLGVGPAGEFARSLEPEVSARVRAAFVERVGPGPIRLTAAALCVRGAVP
jgi:SAM-dependent methyltransferase